LVAADAGKAALRTIAAESTTFASLNIFYLLPLELLRLYPKLAGIDFFSSPYLGFIPSRARPSYVNLFFGYRARREELAEVHYELAKRDRGRGFRPRAIPSTTCITKTGWRYT
jgi:hypothetical protein